MKVNHSEKIVKILLEKNGFTLYRSGYPDYLVEDNYGGLFFVEVKKGHLRDTRLSLNQGEMFDKLASLGLHVYIAYVTGNTIEIREHNPIYHNKHDEVRQTISLLESTLKMYSKANASLDLKKFGKITL